MIINREKDTLLENVADTLGMARKKRGKKIVVTIVICGVTYTLLFLNGHPFLGLFATFGIALLSAFLGVIGYRPEKREQEMDYIRSTEGDFGTAQKMSEEEADEAFKIGNFSDIKEPIFGTKNGKLHALKEGYGVNGHMLVVGASGAGKTRCFGIPFVMQAIRREESLVITDPKLDIYKVTAMMAKAHGYKVKVISFNPRLMLHSDSCNFMASVGTDKTKAQSFANTIMKNTVEGNFDFWAEQEYNLLIAELLNINNSNEIGVEKSLKGLFDTLVKNTPKQITESFQKLSWESPAKANGMIFQTSDEQVRSNTLGGLEVKLSTLANPILGKIVSEPDIDFTQLGKEKCIYYIACSDQDKTYSFYMALFFSLLFQELVAYADSRDDQKLPVKVNFLLDEFKNIGIIPEFPQKLATVRSRGINVQIIIQGLEQLEQLYPEKEWESIIGCCSTFICLRCNNLETGRYFSERCGIETIIQKSRAYERSVLNTLGITTRFRETRSKNKRNAFNTDEICRIKSDELLVIPSGYNAVVLKKLDYTMHPMSKEIKEFNVERHCPKWVKEIIERGNAEELQMYGIEKGKVMFDKNEDDCSDIDLCTEEDFTEFWSEKKQKEYEKSKKDRNHAKTEEFSQVDENLLKGID